MSSFSNHRIFTVLCLLLLGVVSAQDEERFSFSKTTLWEALYVSEGRDNLDKTSLFSIEAATDYRGVTFGAWLASGATGKYQEINLFSEYGLEFGELEACFGYTFLSFPSEKETDNEISARFAMELPWCSPSVTFVYSTGAKGSFLEFSLSQEYLLLSDRIWIAPMAIQALDFGYATPDHDGLNNVQVELEAGYRLSPMFSVNGSIAHSFAQEDVKLEGLGDLTWSRLGLSAEF